MKFLIGFETRAKNKDGYYETKEVKYYASSSQELFDRLMRLRRLSDLYRVHVYYKDGMGHSTVAYVRPEEGSYDPGTSAPVRFEGKGLLDPEYLDEVAGAIWNWCAANYRHYDRSNNEWPTWLKNIDPAKRKKRLKKGDRIRHYVGYGYGWRYGTVVKTLGKRVNVKFDTHPTYHYYNGQMIWLNKNQVAIAPVTENAAS